MPSGRKTLTITNSIIRSFYKHIHYETYFDAGQRRDTNHANVGHKPTNRSKPSGKSDGSKPSDAGSRRAFADLSCFHGFQRTFRKNMGTVHTTGPITSPQQPTLGRLVLSLVSEYGGTLAVDRPEICELRRTIARRSTGLPKVYFLPKFTSSQITGILHGPH